MQIESLKISTFIENFRKVTSFFCNFHKKFMAKKSVPDFLYKNKFFQAIDNQKQKKSHTIRQI